MEKNMKKWNDMSPRERDSLVAEKVMNLDILNRFDTPLNAKIWHPIQHYTTDITAAWEVVVHMKYRFDLSCRGRWKASFGDEPKYEIALTAPEAICLAALRAKGVEI